MYKVNSITAAVKFKTAFDDNNIMMKRFYVTNSFFSSLEAEKKGSLNALDSIISLVEKQIASSSSKSSIATSATTKEQIVEPKKVELKTATTTNVKIPAEHHKEAAATAKKQKGQAKEPENEFTLFNKAYLQVARLVTVDKHPQADKLYLCQVDAGTPERRQLVSGIVDYYTPDQLLNRLVITVANLQKSKIRGIDSNIMLLAGDDSKTTKENRVILLDPPALSEVGDRVYLEGEPIPDAAGSIKRDKWDEIVPKFSVQDNKALYAGKAMITKRGNITVHLANGSSIH